MNINISKGPKAAPVFRFKIELSDVDRQINEELSFSLARHPSETPVRFCGRVLACLLFWHPDMEFTKGICQGDDPDLWVKEGDGRVSHWVEVGLPAIDKVKHACRHASQVFVLPFGKTFRHWEVDAEQLKSLKNLTIARIDDSFHETISSHLDRVNHWSVTITDGVIYLYDQKSELNSYSAIELILEPD